MIKVADLEILGIVSRYCSFWFGGVFEVCISDPPGYG